MKNVDEEVDKGGKIKKKDKKLMKKEDQENEERWRSIWKRKILQKKKENVRSGWNKIKKKIKK